MKNKSEDIFKYYFKELNIFKVAYGKYAGIIRFIIASLFILFVIFYFYKFNLLKFILLMIFFICFMGFFNYSKWKAVKNFRKSDIYFKNRQHLDFGDIRNIKLLEQIHNYNLLNIKGLRYLVDIYNRKSDKFKYPKLTLWAFIIASITQSVIDFCLNAEGKDWNRLESYIQFIKSNIIIVIASIILIIITYFMLKYIISNIYEYFLNLKSNRYSDLCSFLEERVLSLVISLSSEDITDNDVYKITLESIDESVYPSYMERKAKRDCWIKRIKRIKKFFYKCFRMLKIFLNKQIVSYEHLKSALKINDRKNNTDNNNLE